nr:reverse transcriptase domain-containing protein [Tanacetum cinerariifolium]
KNLKEKQLEEVQAVKAQSWKFPVCYDDDDDEEGYNSLNDSIISELPPYSAVTPTELIDSLTMGDEHLNTISATESDEFIKSCVGNLVPNPSESKGENGCDVLTGFTTFSNVLCDDYDSDSSDDQSLSDEDVREKIYSNPLFDEEIIPMEIDQHSLNAESDLIESMPNHDSSVIISSKIDSLFDEFAGELTILKSIPPGIDKTDYHPEKEIRFSKRLLYDNSSPRLPEEIVPLLRKLILFSVNSFFSNQSRRELMKLIVILRKIFVLSKDYCTITHLLLYAKCPMMIHGKNIPILDVLLFHFNPLDQFNGTPTPHNNPIVFTTSPTLTPFGDSDFLLFEEADAFLGLEDDPDFLKINPFYYDPEGDILLLEAILNSEPSPPLPNQEQNLPSFKEELKAYEAQTVKSFVDEPSEVKLKDLPHHLEYAFLEGDNKLPVIIAKELGGGLTVVENEENELIPTRLVTGWRVCIDYRKLNEATRKDHFPLSFMDQMLERLARNEYYCFLDEFFGYFQIPLTLVIKKRQCSPAHIARLPTVACLLACAMLRALFKDKMLQRCKDTNLSLNWEKSHFMVKKGIILGHKISKNETEVDKAKIDAIDKLPHPTTVKGVQSFLSHAGFYRRFIQDFSKISRPMTHLLEKNTPFIFSEDCIKAFQTLKKKLTEAPILIAPNWDLPFELMCDASNFAIGAVWGQRHEKHFKPIHYASKMMNDAETNYTTTEKEMLAVVYAFEKFQSYLIMNKSIVHTDHSAHKYLFS